MKVCHINYLHFQSCHRGGTENNIEDVLRELSKRYEVFFVCSSLGVNRNELDQSIKTYLLDEVEEVGILGKNKSNYSLLWGILEKEKPDIIHLHNEIASDIYSLLAEKSILIKTFHDCRVFCSLGTKIIKSHNRLCQDRRGIKCYTNGCLPKYSFSSYKQQFVFKKLIKNHESIARHLVLSSYMCEELIRHGFDKGKIIIPQTWKEIDKAKDKYHLSFDSRRILYVSRLFEVKGVSVFVDVLKRLDEKGVSFNALIIGDGPERERVKSQIYNYGLESRVSLLGQIPSYEVAEFMEKSAVLVLPYLQQEPFSLTGYEAIKRGLPVVAFAVGGVTDWLEDGVNGYLIPFKDEELMAQKVIDLIENKELNYKLRIDGKRQADAVFRKEIYIQKLIEVYEAVMAENR